MTKDTVIFIASDGVPLTVHRWFPDGEPRALILISHGMAEYAMRYDDFAQSAAKAGYTVIAHDQRGHGETAGSLDRLGYIADTNGFERLAEDLREISLDIRVKQPTLPLILLSQSFGSFVAQLFIERYGNLVSGCILMASRGSSPLQTCSGWIAARLVALFCGKKKPSNLLSRISFGSYNRRIPDAASSNSWLSRDSAEVDAYDASPWSGFTCTSLFYCDLTHGLTIIHKKNAIADIPRNLPIFLLSGTEDPVGSYGKTVTKLASLYRKAGIAQVKLNLYTGYRHELLHETERDAVTSDVLAWIKEHIHSSR